MDRNKQKRIRGTLRDSLTKIQNAVNTFNEISDTNITVRIENLNENLQKIKEYQTRIEQVSNYGRTATG